MNEIMEAWNLQRKELEAASASQFTIALSRNSFFKGALGALYALYELGKTGASPEVGEATLDNMVAECNKIAGMDNG